MSALLEVRRVSVHFGGVRALSQVSFEVEDGELLCLIGPNGAGKTTLLRAITGMVKPVGKAEVLLDNKTITHLPTHQRARLGLAMTHQIVRPFRSMTLLDNVAFAVGQRRIGHVARAMLSPHRKQERAKARELLEVVGIGQAADSQVAGQPLGVLKRLEVVRALALEPRLLLLDEPLAGLNHVEAAGLAETIAAINREGLTVVMIEHNLSEVLRVGRRLMVLDNGTKIAEGRPRAVMEDPRVQAAYLGKGGPDA